MADLKLETLIKVLMMTTSDTDGEALAAIRRANSMLRTAHVDWDALLRGKVTVVADPFDSIAAPRKATSSVPPRTPPPPRPAPSQYARAPRPSGTNRFAGDCLFCGNNTLVGYGILFTHTSPSTGHNTFVVCEPCNDKQSRGLFSSAFIQTAVTSRLRSKATASRNARATFTGTCFNCDVTSTRNIARGFGGNNQLFCISCDKALDDGDINLTTVLANRQARAQTRSPRNRRKVVTDDLMKDIDF